MAPTVLRILITRLSHIGDCLHGVPLVHALRDHLPDAYIAWVVEHPSVPLLEGLRGLDDLIVVRRGWLRSPSAVWNLRRTLREKKFDVAIDPQGLTKSAIVGWLSGARLRIGFAGEDGREISPWLNNHLIRRTTDHVVDRYLELLRPLGITSPHVCFDLPRHPEAEQTIADWLQSQRLAPFMAINPGAGWASRRWPADRYAAVAQAIFAQRNIPSVVVWAGNDECELARQIVAQSSGAAVAAPPTSLRELAALLQRADLLLSSDTGPLHLAVAIGTRTVALHGTTPASKSGPYGPEHVALQEYYQAGTSRQRRSATNDALRAIEVPQVVLACQRQLERGPISKQRSAAASSQAA